MAVEEKSADEPVSRFWTKIGLMAEIMEIFRDAPPEKATYIRAFDSIRKVMPFEGAMLYLFDRSISQLMEEAVFGEAAGLSLHDRFACGAEFTKWVAHQKQPILLENKKVHTGQIRGQDESVLVVPLIVGDSILGVVSFTNRQAGLFRDKDIKLLTIIADQMASSIERLRYQQELEKKNQALIRAQEVLKQAEQERIEDERLKAVRELAVSINHEINNPLSVITGNVEYLQYKNKNMDPKILERLKIIQAEATRIAEINRRLLDIQNLVTQSYIEDDNMIRMINIEKSSVGASNG